MAKGTLTVRILGDASGFQNALQTAQGGVSGFGRAIGGAALAAGAALVTAAGAGLAAFSDLQRGMNEVFTLIPGISQSAMSEMTQQVRDFSTEFGVLPNEVVPALYQALSAGVPPGNVFEFLETANAAAVGGVTDLTTAVDGISSVVNAYGADIISAAQASDLMFTAVRLGKTTFEELSASLSNVNPIAAAMGVQFGDVTAALATMTAQGVPTAQATTQLRQMFVELGDATTDVGQAFSDVAGQSFQDFIAAGGDTGQALEIVREAAANLGVPIEQLFGSVEAGSAALALSGANAEAFTSNLDAMAESAGATQAAYETMDQGVGRALDRIRAQGVVLLGVLGEQLAPAFEVFADWLIANMPAIQEAVQTAFTAIGAAVTDYVIPAFQTLQSAAQPVIDWIAANWQPVLAGLAGVLGGVLVGSLVAAASAIATFLGPATAIIAGLAAVVSALVGAYQTSETFRNVVNTAFAAVRDFAATAWPEVQTIITNAINAVQAAIAHFTQVAQVMWMVFGDTIRTFAASTWAAIQQTVSGAVDIIQGVLAAFAAAFQGDWKGLWDAIQQIVQGSWSMIQGATGSAAAALQATISAAMAAVQTLFAAAWEAVVSAVKAAWEALTSAIKSGIANVQGMMSALPGQLTSAVGNLGGLLVSAGASLIQGLVNGITSRLASALSTVRNMASQIAAAARDALSINSPSKVFMEIGHQVVAGLDHGMQQEAPSAYDTAGVIASQLVGPFTAGMSGTTSDPPTMDRPVTNYTFNVTAPSPRLAAQETAHELRRLELVRGI